VGFLLQGSSKSGGESTDSGSAVNTLSSKADQAQLEPESPISKKASSSDHQAFDQKHLQLQQQQIHQEMTTGPAHNQSSVKAPQEKVLNLLCLTVNLPVLSLSYPQNSGKSRYLYCYHYCFDLSLSLSRHIFVYNSTDPNNSQKIKEVQSFPDF
jgi:hypothetical protein